MRKILIVDDSPTIVAMLRSALESGENAVLTADNGVDALIIARKESPDLMILDLMLPKLDGFHVCTMIKKDALLKKIRVLMLTGRSDEDSKGLGLKCGADKYITKDLGPQEIINTAKGMLTD